MNNHPKNQNWLQLTKNVKTLTDDEKRRHISNIMKTRRQKMNENKTPFLTTAHRIRILCIIKAYFPESSLEYERDLGNLRTDLSSDMMLTSEERRILSGYQNALTYIEKYKDTTKFDTIDRIFGNYRYKKWLETQNA